MADWPPDPQTVYEHDVRAQQERAEHEHRYNGTPPLPPNTGDQEGNR